MSESHLTTEIRAGRGKAEARRLRNSGRVPCVLYGVERDVHAFSVNERDLRKVLSSHQSMISLDLNGKEQETVIKEIQYHPVKGDILHVDFQRLKRGQEVTLSIPLKFVGESPGVKMGGTFQELKIDISITCLPRYLPQEIEIDISEMEIGDSIHVKDLSFENITFNDDLETAICSVAAPRKQEEEVAEEEEEAAAEEGEEAEPEVISKGKAEEESGESAE